MKIQRFVRENITIWMNYEGVSLYTKHITMCITLNTKYRELYLYIKYININGV